MTLKQFKEIITTWKENRKKKKAEQPEPITLLHPKDADLQPTSQKYYVQVKRWRWQQYWNNVPANTSKLPKGHIRVLRKDIYKIPEGFHGNNSNTLIPSGTHTSYVQLGSVNRHTYNMHNGTFSPEPANPRPRKQQQHKQAA